MEKWTTIRSIFTEATGRRAEFDTDAAGHRRVKYIDDRGVSGWTIAGDGVDLDALAADWVENAAITFRQREAV